MNRKDLPEKSRLPSKLGLLANQFKKMRSLLRDPVQEAFFIELKAFPWNYSWVCLIGRCTYVAVRQVDN